MGAVNNDKMSSHASGYEFKAIEEKMIISFSRAAVGQRFSDVRFKKLAFGLIN